MLQEPCCPTTRPEGAPMSPPPLPLPPYCKVSVSLKRPVSLSGRESSSGQWMLWPWVPPSGRVPAVVTKESLGSGWSRQPGSLPDCVEQSLQKDITFDINPDVGGCLSPTQTPAPSA